MSDHQTNYDLQREIETAKLDASSSSRLSTSNGFRIESCEADREILEVLSPTGGKLLISRYIEFSDPANPGASATCYLGTPKHPELLLVNSLNPDYGVSEFIRELVEKFIELDDQKNPEWEPMVVIWED
jgi:hypothetical protein